MAGPDRVDMFFYGLFMDRDLLVAKGLSPGPSRLGSVANLELRLGQRAALARRSGGRAHGVVMRLRLDELERLYAEPGLSAYRAIDVDVDLDAGGVVTARCYNLARPPSPSERNPTYAARLREVAARVGLPAAYVAGIEQPIAGIEQPIAVRELLDAGQPPFRDPTFP